MKKLIILLMLISSNCFAQTKYDTTSYNAGKELIHFKYQFYTGATFEIVGIGVSIIGASTNNTSLTIVGGVIGLAGWIVGLTSFKHIGKAGIILQQNGIGLRINEGKHRKLQQKMHND